MIYAIFYANGEKDSQSAIIIFKLKEKYMQKLLVSVLMIFVGVLLISTTAQCASWVLLATNDSGVNFYCDNDSIKKSILFGDTRKVSIKEEYKSGSTRIYSWEFDCRNYKYRSNETKGWVDIPPEGTILEPMRKHICQR